MIPLHPAAINPVDDTGATVADGTHYGLVVVGGHVTGLSAIATGLTDPTTTKGDLIVRGASAPATRFAVGSNGQVLTADSTQTLGVKWATPVSGSVATDTIWDTKGDLAIATGADAAAKLAVGSNGQILTADSTQTTGVKWAAAPVSGITVQDENSTIATGVTQLDFQGTGITASTGTGEVIVTVPGETLPVSIIDAKGDLILGTADNTAARLAIGTDGQVLTADSTQTDGVKWATTSGTRTINAQTGTSYTAVLSDANALAFLTLSNASAVTFTIPPNSSVAYPVGSVIEGSNLGAGVVTIAPGSGVTLHSADGLKVIQYGTFGMLKTATDTWSVYGRLSS